MNTENKKYYDELIARLEKLTEEERLSWFASRKPIDLRYLKDIEGTTYIIRPFFSQKSDESLIKKTERMILRQND